MDKGQAEKEAIKFRILAENKLFNSVELNNLCKKGDLVFNSGNSKEDFIHETGNEALYAALGAVYKVGKPLCDLFQEQVMYGEALESCTRLSSDNDLTTDQVELCKKVGLFYAVNLLEEVLLEKAYNQIAESVSPIISMLEDEYAMSFYSMAGLRATVSSNETQY
jgi:hypothetical protein